MNYEYKAMDSNGKECQGNIEAKSESDASCIIKEKGMFLIMIKAFDGYEKVETGEYVKEKVKDNVWVYVGIGFSQD